MSNLPVKDWNGAMLISPFSNSPLGTWYLWLKHLNRLYVHCCLVFFWSFQLSFVQNDSLNPTYIPYTKLWELQSSWFSWDIFFHCNFSQFIIEHWVLIVCYLAPGGQNGCLIQSKVLRNTWCWYLGGLWWRKYKSCEKAKY